MAPHSSILAWKIPWTEEPGGLQSMGLLRVRTTSDFTFTFHFHALEKEMATHSSVLAWRIPGTEAPSGLHSMELQSQMRLSDQHFRSTGSGGHRPGAEPANGAAHPSLTQLSLSLLSFLLSSSLPTDFKGAPTKGQPESLCCCLVIKSSPTLLQPHGLRPTRLHCPWDFPGKKSGMGCHFLLH